MSKLCSMCCIEKPLQEFAKLTKIKSGIAGHCKDCDRKRARAYYLKNKEKAQARTEAYRKENLDKHRIYSKRHYETNKHQYRQREMAYQLAKRQQAPDWLTKAHQVEMEGVYQFCQIFSDFQVDHIVPIRGKQISGLHVPWNLRAITRSENAQKSNSFNLSVYPQQGQCAFMES